MKNQENQPLVEKQLAPQPGVWPLGLKTAPRCGAKCKRTGKPCQQPAMPNGRCRIHGGKSPGAPKGNKNAWKHGLYSKETQERHRELRRLLKEAKNLVGEVK